MPGITHDTETWPPGPAGEARRPFDLDEALATEVDDEHNDD